MIKHYSHDQTPKSDKMNPFDQDYTVTGIFINLENILTDMISTKRQHPIIYEKQNKVEIHRLETINEDISILKSIIINEISEVFKRKYHTINKQNPSTTHTQENDKENKPQKDISISDFQLQKTFPSIQQNINSLKVNTDNLSAHQQYYSTQNLTKGRVISKNAYESEQEDDQFDFTGSFGGQDEEINYQRRRAQKFQEQILIEQSQGDPLDLYCYENPSQKIQRKMKKKNVERQNIFSPIIQRPAQQEQSIRKMLEQNRQKQAKSKQSKGQVRREQRVLSNRQNRQINRRLYTSINRYQEQLKRFEVNRKRSKRYNYLEMYERGW